MESVVDMGNDAEFDDFRYANFKVLCFDDIWQQRISVEQDFRLGKGGILWDASWVMSKHLSSIEMQGKNVIELGAGTALPSLLCAAKGGNVYSTDICPALTLTQNNISRNSSLFTHNIHAVELDWTNPEHLNRIPFNHFDYVLLSDVFYLPELADDFIKTLEHFVGIDTVVIICYRFRIEEIVKPYLDRIYQRFDVRELGEELRGYHKNPSLNLLNAMRKKDGVN